MAAVSAERARQRRDLRIAGALVLVAALGGGGYALFGGSGGGKPAAAAKQAATPTPAAAKAYGVTSGGSHYGDLGALLLPMPQNMSPGADFEQYGADSVLGAAQAKTMIEGGDNAGLSAKERKQADTELDAMHIKGAALRTYRNADGSQQYRITIIQVGNKVAAGKGPEAFRRLSSGSDIFDRGPAVPGHPHAVCVTPGSGATEGDDEFDWFDAMYCQATEGDLMVEFQVTGPSPLDKGEAVRVMADQLDRVQAPGEGV